MLLYCSILGLGAALLGNILQYNTHISIFHDMLVFDRFSWSMNLSMIGISILIFLFGLDYYQRMEAHVAEQYALLMFALTGASIITSYNNLIMLFLGIEILSIPLYVLAGGKKKSYRSNEASFKYFLLGSFATVIFLFGVALIYGLTVSFYLPDIALYIQHLNGSFSPMLLMGLLFILIGIAFKVAIAPFHFWSPDVYEGAPTLVSIFMSTVVKIAGFGALFRFFLIGLQPFPHSFEIILGGMVLLSLLIGNFSAMKQSNFKRLLAFASIVHSGFILLALYAQHELSGSVSLYYLLAYSLGTVPLFIIFIILKRAANGLENIEIFRGLLYKKPWLAIVLVVLLMSQAGLPPTMGFFAKYHVFNIAIQQGYLLISLFAIIMAILSIYYYFNIIREAFSQKEDDTELKISKLNGFIILFCTFTLLLLPLLPLLPLFN